MEIWWILLYNQYIIKEDIFPPPSLRNRCKGLMLMYFVSRESLPACRAFPFPAALRQCILDSFR